MQLLEHCPGPQAVPLTSRRTSEERLNTSVPQFPPPYGEQHKIVGQIK